MRRLLVKRALVRCPQGLFSPVAHPPRQSRTRPLSSATPRSGPSSRLKRIIAEVKNEVNRNNRGAKGVGPLSDPIQVIQALGRLYHKRSVHRLVGKSSSSQVPVPLANEEANKPMFEELALLLPAIIPDDPEGIIRRDDSVAKLLDNPALIVERRIEMLNVFLVRHAIPLIQGFEQCNRYVIMNPKGEHVGYLAEEAGSVGTAVRRQFLHTHRSFKAHVLDKEGNEILYVFPVHV
jgi:hypothetical protein